MREAYMKLRGDNASIVCSTFNWRTASFHDMCSESKQSCVALQKV